jgi:hypothetical protein
MKTVRIFTKHSADLPAFFEWKGRRVFASVGICTSVPVSIKSMQDVAIIQIVFDGQCWEGEVVCVAPADETNYCLIAYRMACPVAGNTEKTPGPGYVRYVELHRRGEDLTGRARRDAEDKLAAHALRQMSDAESLNHDGFAEYRPAASRLHLSPGMSIGTADVAIAGAESSAQLHRHRVGSPGLPNDLGLGNRKRLVGRGSRRPGTLNDQPPGPKNSANPGSK